MSCCKKGGNRPVQKVVIPKGMINPGETTIIEIPSNLQKQPIVVAKRKTSLDSFTKTCKSNNKSNRSNTISNGKKDCCDEKLRKEHREPTQYAKERKSQGKPPASADLEDTERKERDQFLRDLDEFQKARRKLLANASFLAGEKGNCCKK